MSVQVYLIECAAVCAVFCVLVFGLLRKNPVSFITDYTTLTSIV